MREDYVRKVSPKAMPSHELLGQYWKNWFTYTDSAAQRLALYFVDIIKDGRWREFSAVPGDYYCIRSDSDHAVVLKEVSGVVANRVVSAQRQRVTKLYQYLLGTTGLGFTKWRHFLDGLRGDFAAVQLIKQEAHDFEAMIFLHNGSALQLTVRPWVIRRDLPEDISANRYSTDLDANDLPGMRFTEEELA